MEIKIVQYWLRNNKNSYSEISNIFNVNTYEVKKAIDNYLKNPYIIRESKMNKL